MKNKMLVILSSIIAVISLSGFSQSPHNNKIYPATMIVISIDENNLITACTASGLTYQFIDDSEDWFIGDLVGMIMDNNNTPGNIYKTFVVYHLLWSYAFQYASPLPLH